MPQPGPGRRAVGDATWDGYGSSGGPTLLHRDRDFECIAAVTGQAHQWYGPEAGR